MFNDLLLKALNKEIIQRPPVWLMRQAGRYLPEYQRIRSKLNFLELCNNPELAAEISLQPYERYGTDAVIVFSDILLPAQKMGLELDFGESGPKFNNLISSEEDIKNLQIPNADEETYPTLSTLSLLKKEVGDKVPIIGFSGAPWTMFCYMVEGGSSFNYFRAKSFLNLEPQLAHSLLNKITNTVFLFLTMQANHGANVLQIFDTWAGILSKETYQTFALPYLKRLVNDLLPLGIPIILYTNGSHHLLDKLSMLKISSLSVDWRCDLQYVRDKYGVDLGLQGNLDPALLLTNHSIIREKTRDMILGLKNWQKGYICNLGHGVLPNTPVENVSVFIDAVHEFASEPVTA